MKIISKVYNVHDSEIANVEWDSKTDKISIVGEYTETLEEMLKRGLVKIEKDGSRGKRLSLKDGRELVENLHFCLYGTYVKADYPEKIEDE